MIITIVVTFFSSSEKQTFHENETDGLNLDDDDYSDQHHHHPLFCYPEKINVFQVEMLKIDTEKEKRREEKDDDRVCMAFLFLEREKLTS